MEPNYKLIKLRYQHQTKASEQHQTQHTKWRIGGRSPVAAKAQKHYQHRLHQQPNLHKPEPRQPAEHQEILKLQAEQTNPGGNSNIQSEIPISSRHNKTEARISASTNEPVNRHLKFQTPPGQTTPTQKNPEKKKTPFIVSDSTKHLQSIPRKS